MRTSNFNLILLICLFGCIPLFQSHAQIRILAIGNSFSEDAVDNYLSELAMAENIDLIIGNAVIGGCSLEKHYNNSQSNAAAYSYRKIHNGVKTVSSGKTLKECIQDEPWDYIALQQVSQYSGIRLSYNPYLENLIAYIKSLQTNPELNIGLHQTWAYAQTSTHSGFSSYGKDQMTMYNAITGTIKGIESSNQDISFVIPSGTAIQNGRSSMVGDSFCRDGYHLSYGLGRYTAACTWFEKITGIKVVGNSYSPDNISDAEKQIAQNAAHLAVVSPWSISPLSNFPYEGDNIIEPTNVINVSFGKETLSPSWNFVTNASSGSILGLKDTKGLDTEIILLINDSFGGVNAVGPNSTNTFLEMPDDVSNNNFYGNTLVFSGKTEPTGGVLLRHLNKSLIYDFVFFGSRNATDNRETYYSISSENKVDTVLLNTSDNVNNIAEIKDIRPNNNGEIEVKVGPGPNNNNNYGFYHITAMQIKVKKAHSNLEKPSHIPFRVYNTLNGCIVEASEDIGQISVINSLGKKITILKNLARGTTYIDLSAIPKGVYFLVTQEHTSKYIKR